MRVCQVAQNLESQDYRKNEIRMLILQLVAARWLMCPFGNMKR
jgi:hypothetical protein